MNHRLAYYMHDFTQTTICLPRMRDSSVAQRGGAAKESQNAKRKTQKSKPCVCVGGKRKPKGKGQMSKGKRESESETERLHLRQAGASGRSPATLI